MASLLRICVLLQLLLGLKHAHADVLLMGGGDLLLLLLQHLYLLCELQLLDWPVRFVNIEGMVTYPSGESSQTDCLDVQCGTCVGHCPRQAHRWMVFDP